jgi:hypothetical protein
VKNRVLVRRPERKRQIEYLGVDGRIISKWMFKKWGVEVQTGLIWLGIGTRTPQSVGLLWTRDQPVAETCT